MQDPTETVNTSLDTYDPNTPSTLKVDWSWKKWRCLITDPSPATSNSMIVHCNFKKPHLEFRDSNDEALIGVGNLHTFKIDSESEVRGVPMHIKALYRLKTGYTHPSQAYAKSKGSAPMNMTWTSSTNFIKWDFVCLDENQEPVARFSSNVWAVKKLGFIEFMGPKANDPAAREEITVVGLTIYYTMVVRMNNIFQLFGSAFAKPGYPKAVEGEDDELREMGGKDEGVASGREVDGDGKMAHARVAPSSSKPMEG